jgi:hypothetical protein
MQHTLCNKHVIAQPYDNVFQCCLSMLLKLFPWVQNGSDYYFWYKIHYSSVTSPEPCTSINQKWPFFFKKKERKNYKFWKCLLLSEKSYAQIACLTLLLVISNNFRQFRYYLCLLRADFIVFIFLIIGENRWALLFKTEH